MIRAWQTNASHLERQARWHQLRLRGRPATGSRHFNWRSSKCRRWDRLRLFLKHRISHFGMKAMLQTESTFQKPFAVRPCGNSCKNSLHFLLEIVMPFTSCCLYMLMLKVTFKEPGKSSKAACRCYHVSDRGFGRGTATVRAKQHGCHCCCHRYSVLCSCSARGASIS